MCSAPKGQPFRPTASGEDGEPGRGCPRERQLRVRWSDVGYRRQSETASRRTRASCARDHFFQRRHLASVRSVCCQRSLGSSPARLEWQAAGCQGCPNQTLCASGEAKKEDPGARQAPCKAPAAPASRLLPAPGSRLLARCLVPEPPLPPRCSAVQTSPPSPSA